MWFKYAESKSTNIVFFYLIDLVFFFRNWVDQHLPIVGYALTVWCVSLTNYLSLLKCTLKLFVEFGAVGWLSFLHILTRVCTVNQHTHTTSAANFSVKFENMDWQTNIYRYVSCRLFAQNVMAKPKSEHNK